MRTPHARSARTLPLAHRGFTLVELMVAMVIGLLVVMAAVASLTVSRTGATAVDTASQLRDDARFAIDTVQRLIVQAGFEDVSYASAPYRSTIAAYQLANAGVTGGITGFAPAIQGFNNAKANPSDPLNTPVAFPAGAVGSGSDTLILRYQSVATNVANAVDGSMIDCAGYGPTNKPISRDDRMASVLYVDTAADGEPALMCIRSSYASAGFADPQPLLKGVEQFQVLYGVDNVVAGTRPTGSVDSVPDGYLRADQLTVAGDTVATAANWRRVRSVRIGMVLRGPLGSAAQANTATLYPLGSAAYSSSSDAGTSFRPTDTRLRQVVTFTVQLRNCQNQGYQPANSTVPCDVAMPS